MAGVPRFHYIRYAQRAGAELKVLQPHPFNLQRRNNSNQKRGGERPALELCRPCRDRQGVERGALPRSAATIDSSKSALHPKIEMRWRKRLGAILATILTFLMVSGLTSWRLGSSCYACALSEVAILRSFAKCLPLLRAGLNCSVLPVCP